VKLSSAPALPEKLDELVSLAVQRDAIRADNTSAVVARLGDAEEEHPTETPVNVMLDDRLPPENF
jgi:hypothetical protein